MIATTSSPIARAVLALAASGVILGFVAMPAMAASVPVKVKPAELESVEGRASVDNKIATAARRACARSGDYQDLSAWRDRQICVARAIEDARVQLAGISQKTLLASR